MNLTSRIASLSKRGMKLWHRDHAGLAPRRKRPSPLALAAVAAFCGLPLHAATQVWQGTGANGNWSTTGNFAPGAPFAITDDLQFDGFNFLGDNFNDLTLQSVASLTFNAGADSFTLNGNGLNTGAGGIVNLSPNLQTISLTYVGPNVTQTWDAGAGGLIINSPVFIDLSGGSVVLTIAGAGDTTINGNIAPGGGGVGVASLVKNGSGILTLANAVNVPGGGFGVGIAIYTGGTTINAGTVSFAYGSLGYEGTIDFAGNSTLQWFGNNTEDISARLKIEDGVTATIDTNGNDVTFATTLQLGAGMTAALTKTGTGVLTLAAANDYTGVTTVNGGLINFANGNNLGTGNITLDGGGLQWAAGNTEDISSRLNAFGGLGATFDTNGNDVTLASALTGTGGLTKSGAGTLALTSVDNTYSGGTTINAGTVSVTSDGNLGKDGISFFGGELLVDGSTFSTSKSVEVFDGATGRLSNSDSANPAFLSGNVNLGAGSTLAIGSAGNTGTIVLMPSGGSATAASSINVDFGTLLNGSGASFNALTGPATVNVAVGATLDLGGYDTSIGNLLGAGVVTNSTETGATLTVTTGDFSGMIQDGDQPLGLTKIGGSDDILTLTGINNYSDGTTINGGLINFTAGNNLGSGNITLDSAALAGGGLQWAAGNTTDISSRLNALGAGGGIFDTNGNNVTFDTALFSQVGGGITKTGAGTLALNAVNSYGGATIVDAGTLQVNGSIAGFGTVSVNSGATLAGTGSISGAVTVADGGILAPGASPGTITLGSLTLNAASMLNYELDTAGVVGGGVNDLIIVTGSLTLDGVLTVTNVGSFGVGTYRLINYTNPESPLTNNGLGFGVMPSGFTYAITFAPNEVNLIVDQVLEQYWDGPNFTANGTVEGGTGTWDNSLTNWTKPDGSFNGTWSSLTAVFSATAGTVTLGDNITFGGLKFLSDGYVINADVDDLFTLSPTGAASVAVDPGLTATINARITGEGGLIKDNTGTLILTAANSYTGGTTLMAGTVAFSTGSLGTTGTVDFAGNSTLRWNTGTEDISSRIMIEDGVTATFDTNNNDVTFASALLLGTEQSAAVTKIGTGTLTFTAQNGYIGTTTINEGILAIDNDGTTTFGSHGAGPVVVNGGASEGNNGGHMYFLNSATAGNGPFTINGPTSAFGGNGTVEFFGTSSASTATYTANGGTFNGGIGGTVFFNDDSTASTANLIAEGSATSGGVGGNIVFFGNSTAANSTLTANGGTNGGTGGSIFFFGDSTGGTTRVIVNDDGSLNINLHATPDVTIGSLEGSGNVFLGIVNLTVGSNDLSTTFSGRIQGGMLNDGGGGGSVTKIGDGTLTLSGTNDYTGATQVNAGTLLVTGSITETNGLTVNSGGTLGGTGTVRAPVTVADGGTLAPGASAGTITLGTLTLNAASILAYELDTPNIVGGGVNDLTIVNGFSRQLSESIVVASFGNLTLDGLLNVTDVGGFGEGTYRLIDYTGAFTDNTLDIAIIPSGFSYRVDTATAGQVNLVVGTVGLQFWDGTNTAANGVVDGGTATWNNVTTNWTNATGSLNGAWNSQTGVFGGTAGTVTLGDNVAFAGLQFVTNGYVINGGSGEGGAFTLTPTGAATVLVNSGLTATINAQITGAGGLVKVNMGTLILTAANTYTGGTNLNAGTVGFSNDSLGTTGTVDFAGSATLRWNGGNTQDISSRVKIEDGVTATFDTNGNNVTFATTLQLGPSKTAALTKAGAGTLTLTAPNTYTGTTTVDGGILAVDNNGTTTFGTLGTGKTNVGGTGPGAQLIFLNAASAGNGAFETVGGSNFSSGGSIVFQNNSTASAASIRNDGSFPGSTGGSTIFNDTSTAGTAVISNGPGIPNLGLTVGKPGATYFNNSSSAANATITNSGGVGPIQGKGAPRNDTGGFTIFDDTSSAGTASITNGGAFGNALGGKTLFAGSSTAANATLVSDPGTVSGLGGETRFTGSSTAANATLVANGSTLLEGGGFGGGIVFTESSTGGTSTVKVFGNGFLDIIGHTVPGVTIGSLEGSGNVFLGGNILTVGSNGASTLFSGIIQDQSRSQDPTGGSLNKIGPGTLELTGANLYTGATNVQAGTLRVNNTTGSATGTGAVTVQSGATLAGGGTITGPVTVFTGGTLSPGNSPGTITVGTLTLNTGSLLPYELAAPNIVGGGINDLTTVNGSLTLDGTLNITALSGFGAGTYRLFDYTGLLTNNILDIGTAPSGLNFSVDVATPSQVNLIVTGFAPVRLPIAYWNGTHTTPNGIVNGGTFTWDNVTTNWTNEIGAVSGTWANGLGIFAGTAGTVTIIENIIYTGLQFSTNGYIIDGVRGLSLMPNGIAPITTDGGVTATIDAMLTGGGGLAKEGAGTLILTNLNTYTGNTFVNGGTLLVNGSITSPQVFVNPGGVLGGHGILFGHVTNSGVVSPGTSPGTLHIKGNYTQSSAGTLLIEVGGRSAGEFDVLDISGHASLGGTLQFVRLNNFKLKRGDKLEILSADGGISGEFSEVNHPFKSRTILKPGIVYEDNAVFLTLIRQSFELDGLTPNQRSVARALDRVTNDRRMEKIFAYLDERVLEKLPGDFDKIAPDELASIFNFVTALANLQGKNLERRTGVLRSGGSGFSSDLTMQGNAPSYASTMEFRSGAAGPTGNESKESKEVLTPAPDNRWGVFLTGVGEWVDVDGDGNGRGYDITTGGFTLGLDYKVCPNFAVGIAAGYAGTGIDLTDDGSVLVNGGKLAVYATTFIGGWYADAAVTGGYNSYDTKRSALQGTARGSTDGGELNVLLGTGYDWKLGGLQIGPTANFNYTLTGIDGYTEHGSLAPLNIASHNAESVRSAFGFKASYDWKLGGVIVKPEIRAAWQHEYGDSSYDISSSFANGAGGRFLVNGPEIGRDSLLLGAGFAVQLNERAATYLYYDGELGRTRYDSHSVSGGLRIAF